MHINMRVEAKIAKTIANQYFGQGAYSAEDFYGKYVSNVLDREANTQQRNDCAREIVDTLHARRESAAAQKRVARFQKSDRDRQIERSGDPTTSLVDAAISAGVPEWYAREVAPAYTIKGMGVRAAAQVMVSDWKQHEAIYHDA